MTKRSQKGGEGGKAKVYFRLLQFKNINFYSQTIVIAKGLLLDLWLSAIIRIVRFNGFI